MIAATTVQFEAQLSAKLNCGVEPALLARWRTVLAQPHRSGLAMQTWLWAAPAKHSTRQISEVLERIKYLYELDVHRHLDDIPDALLRRYARRLTARKPAVSARI